MAKETIIKTRGQLGKYLNDMSRETCKLYYQRSVLRELVADAYQFKDRMPKRWNADARKALREIAE